MVRYWISLLLGFGAIGFSESRAIAQSNIVEDPTVGTQVTRNFQGFAIEAIQGGTERGQNLFHSFQEFNISPNRVALFLVPNGTIQNVFARVTGRNLSQIDGTLGTRLDNTFAASNANLFLMNPNGIIFGAGGRLDVGGSFVATTANAIGFGNNAEFSTTSSGNAENPLLRIDPSVFIFNQVTGRIENRSTASAGTSNRFPTGLLFGPALNVRGLRVPDGQSLILLGGEVLVDNSGLNAFGGRVEIGGVAGSGRVNIDASGSGLQLSFPGETPRANVSVSNTSRIETIAGGGGDIAVYANRFELTGNSDTTTGIGFGLGAVGKRAGDVKIDATENVLISGSSINNNIIIGTGSSGSIDIRGRAVEMNNSLISNSSLGVGDSGRVNIQARDSILLRGSFISTFTGGTAGLPPETLDILRALGFPIFTGTGNGGDISLEANSIFLPIVQDFSLVLYWLRADQEMFKSLPVIVFLLKMDLLL